MPGMEKIRLSDYGFSILQLETQPWCNMNCKFCAYPIRKEKTAVLPDKYVLEIIDDIDQKDDKLEYICLSHFNEPLMDKRIFKFIEYAKKRGHKVLIITNGLLFSSEQMGLALVRAAPDYIKISFQTLNENHFKTRGIDYPFGKYKNYIYEFLKLALDKNCASQISIDVACNFMSREKMFARKAIGMDCGDPSVPNAIKDIKNDVVGFLSGLNQFDGRFKFNEHEIIKTLDHAKPNYLDQIGITIAHNIKLKIKQFIHGRRLSEFEPIESGKPCSTRILGIMSNGSVVPCCLAYDQKLCMGNIKTESLCSILERNKEFIKIIKQEGGKKLPLVCKMCQGAPTRRGAMLLGIIKSLQKR